MYSENLKKLIYKGVGTGLLASACLTAAETSASASTSKGESILLKAMESATGGNFGYSIMTEEELMLELTPEGAKLYNSLTPEGKRLALVVASSRCDSQNECKGLNGCKTDKNDCAGKGSCKGQSKCAVATKDLAVKLVATKMAQKRAEAAGTSNDNKSLKK
jgi:hypothetical protein